MIKLNKLYKCDYDIDITGISINSKTTTKGDIFVCIKGNTCDRHDFTDEAIQNGAVALVVAHEVNSSVPYIIVNNPNDEVVTLSQKIYNDPQNKLKMMSITGTDGKTSVATITSTLIGPDKCGYIGTNGYSCEKIHGDTDNTTPSPDKLYKILNDFVTCGCETVCMEASSEAMLQGRLDSLKFISIGMTNITSEHLNSHKTLENYVSCKKQIMSLTTDNGYCILNHDDHYYQEVLSSCHGKVLTYGKGADNDLIISSFKLNSYNTEITFKYQNKKYEVSSPLLGEFNVYNLACSLLMCLSIGYQMENLLKNIQNINVSGRLDIIDKGQNFTVMVDYAHTPNGISKLLDFVKLLDHKRIIVVIGQAGERDIYKRKEVGKIVATKADLAIFCYEDPRSEDPRDIIAMMCEEIQDRDNYRIIIDRSLAIKYAIDIAEEGDIVLILGKGNETYQKLKTGKIYFNDEEETVKALNNRLNN